MGSTRTFVMTVPEHLGPIYKLHLWHDDNGGRQSHWYVRQIVVEDLHAGVRYVLHLCT